MNPWGERTSWVYDAVSRPTAQLLGNGTRTSYSYDAGSRLTRLANLGTGGATLSSFGYAYDGSGMRTGVQEATGDRVAWTYNATNQLVCEVRTAALKPAGLPRQLPSLFSIHSARIR